MAEQAKQTPLVELLDAVPADVRIGVRDGEDWNAGMTWHPVGFLCHEAAAELRRLQAANLKLAGAIDMIRETLNGGNVDDLLYIINTALAEHRGDHG
jgi:hypothetical protein